MRKRNIPILFRLNKKEAESLDKKVRKSGLNREAYDVQRYDQNMRAFEKTVAKITEAVILPEKVEGQ